MTPPDDMTIELDVTDKDLAMTNEKEQPVNKHTEEEGEKQEKEKNPQFPCQVRKKMVKEKKIADETWIPKTAFRESKGLPPKAKSRSNKKEAVGLRNDQRSDD